MDFDALLEEIQSSQGYSSQIVHVERVPARDARYGVLGRPLSAELTGMLAQRGIEQLYTHQVEALEEFRNGRNPLIVTGTASGKSLCYQLPILEMLMEDPNATALLLFPSKALSQDQLIGLQTALKAAGLSNVLAGVCDGDTPATARRRLRDHGSVVITNPDMLHAAIMPQHARWASFLSRLRLVVVDELHVYNGIFGSSVTNLFRRFHRLCQHYGSHPTFIACSATIGNPDELAQALVDRTFTLIDNDGSPRGERTYVLWNPPTIRNTRTRSRRSANVEAHELMAMLITRGVRTIAFTKAKMVAEMVYRYVAEALARTAPHLARRISPYRGGYLPEDRREIEAKLFSGELMGVSATRALELGIDVGGLDAAIMVGYPGTLASFFQQSGRAGRSSDESLSILVGLDTPINQYVMTHPEYLFGRPVESAVIDPDNPFVVMGHLRCAAQEMALADNELKSFGSRAPLAARILEENLKLAHIDGHWYHSASEIPQHGISLRGYSDSDVAIHDVDTGVVLGQLDKLYAPPILHPEAIYMHQGDTYRVLELDLERRLCYVKRVEVDYYTQALGGTDVHHIDHTLRAKQFGTGMAYWGEVTAKFGTWGYEKVRFYELDAISIHPVDLRDTFLETMAFWLVPPESLMERVVKAGLDPQSGLKGIGFATRMVLPLFMTCDTLDFSHTVGSVNAPWNAIFIYERYLLGLGFTEKAYNLLHLIMQQVLDTIRRCPCEDGCPCCVGKPLRGEVVWNVERGEATIPSKSAALMILDGYLGDLTNLDNPDTSSMQDSDADAELRMERALRRRLERAREPRLPHPIDPTVPVAYPDPVHEAALDIPDQEARAEGKMDFSRRLRQRLSDMGDHRLFKEGTPLQPSDEALEPPSYTVVLGDSLASRARRRKKESTE